MSDTKPAVASGTLWGGFLAFVPILSYALDAVAKSIDLINQSGIVLPPKTAAVIAGVGGAIVWLRRITNKDTKPISGIVTAK